MKRKGFTLVELLVVISIIALLMAILMPVLSKVKAIANQMVCGTNLAGIGKGMILYAGDNEDEYPIAGGRRPQWGNNNTLGAGWCEDNEEDAYGATEGALVTVSSSLYLLVKYTDMGPKQFICRGDIGTKEFKLTDWLSPIPPDFELTDAWDFGPEPGTCCSYSYHMPYTGGDSPRSGQTAMPFPINSACHPSSPICGDRNLYADKNAQGYRPNQNNTTPNGDPAPSWDDSSNPAHYLDRFKTGNAACHQRNGQNVLFNDSHVNFEKYPNCGVNQDNIYRAWGSARPTTAEEFQVTEDGELGGKVGDVAPKDEEDAFLANERNDVY